MSYSSRPSSVGSTDTSTPTPWLSPSSSQPSSASNSGWQTWSSGEGVGSSSSSSSSRRSRRAFEDTVAVDTPHALSSARPRSGAITPADVDIDEGGDLLRPPSWHTPSATHSRRSPNVSGTRMPSSTSASANGKTDQWWEHVLPPGQLAERLRRAQAMTNVGRPPLHSSNDSASSPDTSSSVSPSMSRNGTRSERSIWTGFAELSAGMGGSEAAAGSRRSGAVAASTHSDARLATSRRPGGATSSASNSSSLDNSSDERSGLTERTSHSRGAHATPVGSGWLASAFELSGKDTSAAGIPWPDASHDSRPSRHARTSTTRRSRVLSEDALQLKSGPQHVLPVTNDGSHPSWPAPTQDASLERSHGSEEDRSDSSGRNGSSMSTVTSTTVRKRRISRTVSITSTSSNTLARNSIEIHRPDPTANENASSEKMGRRRSMPLDELFAAERVAPPRGHKHSLSSAGVDNYKQHTNLDNGPSHQSSGEEAERRPHVSYAPTTGRSWRDKTQSFSSTIGNQKSGHSAHHAGRDSVFDTLPPSANRYGSQGARRTRTVSSDGFVRRTVSFSAPTSPRHSMYLPDHARARFDGAEASFFPRREGAGDRRPSLASHARDQPSFRMEDEALLRSLDSAQHQLANAGSLALGITRQLSAPLRPVLHLWLFLSISSVTLLTLVSCLAASYALTVWDDLGKRGRRVGKAAGKACRNVEAGLGSCRKILAGAPFGSAMRFAASAAASSANDAHLRDAEGVTGQRHGQGRQRRSSMMEPLHFAIGVASRMVPNRKGEESGLRSDGPAMSSKTRPSGSAAAPTFGPSASASGSSHGNGKAHFPPRPPLSHLLPSLFFTVALAFIAGLASFFANKRAAAEAASVRSPMAAQEAFPGASPHLGGGGSGGVSSAAAAATTASTILGSGTPTLSRSNSQRSMAAAAAAAHGTASTPGLRRRESASYLGAAAGGMNAEFGKAAAYRL